MFLVPFVVKKEKLVMISTIHNHTGWSDSSSGCKGELSTAGFGLPCNETYASPNILKKCVEREISITLTADAHEPSRHLFEYERGMKVLQEAGIKEIARFSRREIRFEALDLGLRSLKQRASLG